jgi:aldehyde dehydrogenase (NAD+)
MMALKIAPVLASGSTCILKPCEQTPLSALKIAELIQEAGIPEGVINIIPAGGEVGEALVKHPLVDKVAFTGSTNVGKHIMSTCHEHTLKRVSLELGGKSPNIIMNDANMDLAVEASQLGMFLNSGQVCMAGTRVFVQEGAYDEFVARTVEASKQRKIANQFEEGVVQGP